MFGLGKVETTVGAGVSNVKRVLSLSTPPTALFVPALISIWYVVACGNRTSGSNSTVRVPIQRQWPFGVGVSITGTIAAASSCEVTPTIGWLNVTESSGA